MPKSLLKKFLLALLVLLAISCGKSSSSSSDTPTATPTQTITPKSDKGGVVTGALSAGATLAQVVSASDSSTVKGTSVSFPPGSLKTNVDITVQEADGLASANTALDLKIDPTSISAASKTVLVTSSGSADPVKPFTLSIPLGTGLHLATTHAVLYRITKAASPGKVFTGFLAAADFTEANGVVAITASYWGAYQVVDLDTTVDITKVKEALSTAPIVPLANIFPTTGTFLSDCKACRNNVKNCYEQDTFTSQGSSITIDYNTYADSSCVVLTALTKSTAYITYVVGSAVKTPAGATAVDGYFARFIFTPVSSVGETALNDAKFCNFTDWKSDKGKDITGLDCDPNHPDAYKSQTIYSTFKIKSSVLTLGSSISSQDDDGTTAAKRMLGTDAVTFTLQ